MNLKCSGTKHLSDFISSKQSSTEQYMAFDRKKDRTEKP